MAKIDLVKKILAANTEIAEWYDEQHNVTADDLTHQNVREYGVSGYGEIADQILRDGIDHGVITNDDLEAA